MIKRFYRRHRKIVNIVAIVLVTTILVGMVAASTNLISKISNTNIGGFRERNDNNWFSMEGYENLDGTKINGINIDVDDDGVITLNGKAKGDTTISLGDLTSQDSSNKYLWYISGCLDGSLDTYYFEIASRSYSGGFYQTDDNHRLVYNVISVNSSDTLTINIIVKDGTDLNDVKFYPGVFMDADATYFTK